MWHQVTYFPSPPYPADHGLPQGHIAYRPVITVQLSGQSRLNCLCIIDSGADHCVFPLSFALQLGFNPLGATQVMTGGVGSAAVPMYFWKIKMDLGPVQKETMVGFTEDMNSKGIGLLGQHGFFEYFKVQFDLPSKLFWIEVPDRSSEHQPSASRELDQPTFSGLPKQEISDYRDFRE
jgi:hypothetical protein